MNSGQMSGKKVAFIYTGGTIGSTPTSGNAALSPTQHGEYLLDRTPGLYDFIPPENIRISNLMQIDSTDMLHKPHRRQIANEINRFRQEGCDAVVVSHGTDQLTNTATYMTLNLPFKGFPVIYTGSMIPINDKGSDAPSNIYGAFVAALDGNFIGDYIYFNGRLLHGVRSVKTGAEKHVFESMHYPVIADMYEVNPWRLAPRLDGKVANKIYSDRMRRWASKFNEQPTFKFDEKVVRRTTLFRLSEDFTAAHIEKLAAYLDGFVIEGWGTGGIPNTPEGEALSEKIYKWTRNGKVIAICSRVPQLKTNLTEYVVGKRALEGGAVAFKDRQPDVTLSVMRENMSLVRAANEYDPLLVKRLMFYNLFDDIDPLTLQDLETQVRGAGLDVDVDGLRISEDEVEYIMKKTIENQNRHPARVFADWTSRLVSGLRRRKLAA